MSGELARLATPEYISKIVDFVLFAVLIVWLYVKKVEPELVKHQDAENKAVALAQQRRADAASSIERAQAAIGIAKSDAERTVETAQGQSGSLIEDERAEAQARGQRIVAHAQGELERERYRVRLELLVQTVDTAYAQAREIVGREIDGAFQHRLVDEFIRDLEGRRV